MKKYSYLSLFTFLVISWTSQLGASQKAEMKKQAQPASGDLLIALKKHTTKPTCKGRTSCMRNATCTYLACKERAAWYAAHPRAPKGDEYIYIHTILGMPCNSDIIEQSTRQRLRHLERATQAISDCLECEKSTPFLEHAYLCIDMHTPRMRCQAAGTTKEKT